MVWPCTTPSWSDPTYVRTATLPAGYETAGEDGWYAGHIPAGASMTYGNLGIWAYQ